jgi:CRISPR-associated protein Cmr2
MMPERLLALSIGPVQDFIAAARRTRDLWFGSYALSELSKAAARAILEKLGTYDDRRGGLIFPYDGFAEFGAETNTSPDDPGNPDGGVTLPRNHPLAPGEHASVANVILVRLGEDVRISPKELTDAAEIAARRRWEEFARETKEAAGDGIRSDWFDLQAEDLVEFNAAWVSMACKDDYPAARRRVMRLLAGRKALRDFRPNRVGERGAGVPKSSLDGARESVLLEDDGSRREIPNRLRARLRLGPNEQLDAVGLIKRLCTDKQWLGPSRTYPSVSRVAVESWLRGVGKAAETDADVRGEFESLRGCCDALVGAKILNRVRVRRDEANLPGGQRKERDFGLLPEFPYEGQALFPGRWFRMLEEAGLKGSGDTSADLNRKLLGLPDAARRLFGRRRFREPDPYLAVLVADGDRMGKAISALKTPGEHRNLSGDLAKFASRAAEIVEENQGVCIYAGGDDVMAVLPLHRCVACARALHDAFGEGLRQWSAETGTNLSLSVGIAMGHVMENLEDLLGFAREAEKRAKEPRNGEGEERDGLALTFRTRGNAPVVFRANWNGLKSEEQDSVSSGLPWSETPPDRRLLDWARLFALGELPNKLPYDIRARARFFRGWPEGSEGERERLKDAIGADMRVLLKRKEPNGEKGASDSSTLLRMWGKRILARNAAELEALAEFMLLAQQIGVALDQAGEVR